MTRPKNCRKIMCDPCTRYFIPFGTSYTLPDEVLITLDEFEALRLADLEGLYQEKSAELMNVSRQTFGRIIDSARKKIAEALVHGKPIKIEGGYVSYEENGKIICCRGDMPDKCCINNSGSCECKRCRKS